METLSLKDDNLLWMAMGEGEKKTKPWDPPVPASQSVCLAPCSFYKFFFLPSLFKMQARSHVACLTLAAAQKLKIAASRYLGLGKKHS